MKRKAHRYADGGPAKGDDLASEDLGHKNMSYTYESNVEKEAEEKKRGGRTKRRYGGKTVVGHVSGKHAAPHAGKAPRKARGGSAPFSAAHRGVQPVGHKTEDVN